MTEDISNGFETHSNAAGLPDMCSMLSIAIMNLPTGLFICDKNGVVVFLNKAYAKYLGIEPGDAIGKHITQLIKDSRITGVLKSGKPVIGAIRYMEKTQQEIVTNRYPLYNSAGELIGAMSMVVLDQPEQLSTLQKQVDSLANKVKSYADRIKVAFEGKYTIDSIICVSKPMMTMKKHLLRFAQTDDTVLIHGSTGTGKELVASAIHNASKRSNRPYVSINCAAIPQELFESELFGYAPGAFSGARKEGKEGMVELADKGTLFLDEVGDLPLGAQVKLLRVIEERVVRRVGDRTPRPVDFRLVTATNRDLSKMVAEGSFRQDLYYRINSMVLSLPDLKDRAEDIPVLVEHMLERHHPIHCSPEVMDLLVRYMWPGNVRELKNVLAYALSLVDGDTITINDLPPSLVVGSNLSRPARQEQEKSLGVIRDSSERSAILVALRESRWNVTKAANILGISRANIYYKIKKHGIKRYMDQ